jgi:Sec8 exocyst complex component specific domain
MGGDECIPVQVALQLSDPSTLGLATREPEFQQAHSELQKALRSLVNGMRLLLTWCDFHAELDKSTIRTSTARLEHIIRFKQAYRTLNLGCDI